ncbi:MAG TPA: polysaccharide deacetylase family protein [Candidatus Krumholzibacteria bacterium]|nr:polysaccharide deacetylase family protein [Candidatus Krumholzibacteria bacterium]
MIGALLVLAAALAVPEHAVILLYHHVDEGTPASTSTRPDDFRRHLALIEASGAVVLPLEAIAAGLADDAVALPDPAVGLSFDDGYRSVYTEAFPLLRARGWPFTVFVSPEAIDRREGPVCTWDQLREMAAAGATIAGHGLRHEHLQRLRPGEDADRWRARTRAELEAMRQRLVDEIGAAPVLLAYPFGEWSPALAEVVDSLGLVAFGQQSGPAWAVGGPAPLPRFPAAGPYADPGDLARKLRTLPWPVVDVAPRDPRLPGGAGDPRPPLRLVLTAGFAPAGVPTAFDGGHEAPVALRGDTLVVAAGPVPAPGRARTNVTAPSMWPGRWYWYSHAWIVGEEHVD